MTSTMYAHVQQRSLLSPPVLLLAAVAFVIGTAEFVAIGLVPQLARDLNTTVGAAGLTVTVYALSVGILAIPLGLALAHRHPRALLTALLFVFAAANLVAAAAPGLPLLLIGRIASAATQGVALGVAVSTVTTFVAPEARGKAVSLVFGGLMSAMFLGAPIGTYLGGVAGWRAVFVALAVLGAVLAAGLWTVLPRRIEGSGVRGGIHQLRVVTVPGVLGLLGVAVGILLVSNFFFPYLGVYLEQSAGMGSGGISMGLGVFGVAGLLGNAIGGYLGGRADTFWVTVLAVIAMVAVAALALSGGSAAVVFPALAVWGAAQMAALPIVTTAVVALGGGFAATLNVALVNLAIAAGGFVGGTFAASAIDLLPWLSVGGFGLVVAVLAARHLRAPEASAVRAEVG
ncbi:MFS transporter [Rhodococcus sp. IEGM1428]|uniref:MFS transporter n=1 Tax=Rhodococcus sp. IEGM1428 TaxID=3392191 RepID=UPI003D1067C0